MSKVKQIKKISFVRELQNALPRQALITIYQKFVRPHLDYTLHQKRSFPLRISSVNVAKSAFFRTKLMMMYFIKKLEKIQYNAFIIIVVPEKRKYIKNYT